MDATNTVVPVLQATSINQAIQHYLHQTKCSCVEDIKFLEFLLEFDWLRRRERKGS